MAYGSVWGVLALIVESPLPVPGQVDVRIVTLAAFVSFTVLLLAVIGVVGRSLRSTQRFSDDRLMAEIALTVAGGELLSNADEDDLVNALEAVREAIGAEVAFVAENSGDRRHGPAAVVRQVSAAGGQSTKWTLPYMQHRAAAGQLARGRPVRLDDALGLVMGREPGTTAALAVPISVRGEWAGFLGLAFTDLPTPEPDISALDTIAAMIGSFLERQRAYARLEKAVHSKDQFLAGISHEIRTPLTSILGFASVLREDDGQLTGLEVQELARLIQLQSQDVSDLVEDLLVAARTEIDAVRINVEPVNLSVEIDRVLSARIDIDNKDLHVVASPGHIVLADPTRVRQILRNLLTNAVRYGGAEITITTHRDGPEIALVFSDNGEGVPPEQRRRIFDPYHRGLEAMTRSESIGLGLTVSRQLARLMGGDLTLRSDLGPATFQLSLPTAPQESRGTEPADEDALATAE
jgi:signal transduction histidine kinase